MGNMTKKAKTKTTREMDIRNEESTSLSSLPQTSALDSEDEHIIASLSYEAATESN
jgi:hypothetical protein